MFDRVSQAAEKLATNVSRREVMGQLGRGALVLAGVLAGICASPRIAQAGKKGHSCCYGAGGCLAPETGCKFVWSSCGECMWKCSGGRLLSSACEII